MTKKIIIYRDNLLPFSETFIPAQVENFSSYTGFYVGTLRPQGKIFPIPQDRSIVLSDFVKLPAIHKRLFILTGLANPSWFNRLRELSPTLIHAHFGFDGLWALPISKRLNIPLIVTFHGYDITTTNHGKLYQLYLWQRQKLFKEARCCIAVSEFIRSKMIQKGCPSDKIIVHYIGVDVDKFRVHHSHNREPIVLFVGRLVEKKGCEYLIRAMAQVQSVAPNLKLVIIGDGELRSTLEQQAKKLLTNYCFLGVQSSDAIREWMNNALLLAAPSVTSSTQDTEGLPISILEAYAMELPVVASVHAGIPEAVVHKETGFLAPEKDWQALAENILTLFRNPQLRESFAKAGRKCVEQKFNLKLNTAKLEAIYDRILNEPQKVV
ncbi:MAG: glycosyltransferase [Calothrix sp. MO_167.B42]|nr:glycosyltransferase [Calothrix sp. MO_167.B42]